METLFCILIFGIIIGLIAILSSFKFMINNKVLERRVYYGQSIPVEPMIIERAYKAVDLKCCIEYSYLEEKLIYGLGAIDSGIVVKNEDHKQHLIKEAASRIGIQMHNDGLIDVIEEENEYSRGRRILMRAKVYKEDL